MVIDQLGNDQCSIHVQFPLEKFSQQLSIHSSFHKNGLLSDVLVSDFVCHIICNSLL